MLKAIPWSLYTDDTVRFWVHYGLVILGFVLAVITLVAQWVKPAPYGKHESNTQIEELLKEHFNKPALSSRLSPKLERGYRDGNWGPQIHQRLGHILSDATPGVLLFILSADEKLRSLGHHKGHQTPKSNTYYGPQNPVTESSISANRTAAPDVAPPPVPAIVHQDPLTKSDDCIPEPNLTPLSDEPPPLYPKPQVLNPMAERRIQRNQRDDHRNGEKDERAAAKCRSRSAGPHNRRRVRNSMHETSSTKMQHSNQYTNGRHSMYVEALSDDEVLKSGSDSGESDELMQSWTKNPLMVKKTRKGERNAKSDKRRSFQNTENGVEHTSRPLSQRSNSKEMFIYPSRIDSSPSSSHKAKFQRMEENRKKRIDMAVTSDEECSPELRISRLRQRAMLSSKIFNDDMNVEALNQGGDDNTYYHSNGHIPQDDQQRVSQYDEVRNGKYSENYNIGNVNDKLYADYKKAQALKHHPKLPNVLPEYLPQANYGKPLNVQLSQQDDGYYRNKNDSRKIAETSNPGRAIPVLQQGAKNVGKQNNPQQSRVKVASESPKLRSFNEVKANQPTQLKQAVEKFELNPRSPNSSSEDSLDELIESNIQYLESEIESGKLKRQSGNFSNVAPVKTSQGNYISPIPVQTGPPVAREPVPPTVPPHRGEIRSRLQIPVEFIQSKSASENESLQQQKVMNRSNYVSSSSAGNISNTSAVNVPSTGSGYVHDHRNIGPYGSATYSPYMQRRNIEHNTEDMSKSDSQLNTVDTRFISPQNYFAQERGYVPYPVLNTQTGNIMYVQPGNMEDIPMQGNRSSSLPNAMDTGMFSDVDYDIEVSERIKKWEKKLLPGQTEESRKVLNTIQEYESMSDSNQDKVVGETPLEIRRELRQLLSPSSNSGVGKLSVSLAIPSSSVSDSNLSEHSYEPKVVSSETNLHRIFRVVQEPRANVPKSGVVNVEKRRKTSFDYPAGTKFAQSMSNVTMSETETGGGNQQAWPPMVDSDSGIRKSWRMSRYEDEINELKEIVSDNFRDLKKRFDSDVSETDTYRASSPVQVVPQKSRAVNSVPVTLNIQTVTPTSHRSPVVMRRATAPQLQNPPQFAACYTQHDQTQYIQPRPLQKPPTPPLSPRSPNVTQNIHSIPQNIQSVPQNIHNVPQNIPYVSQNIPSIPQNIHSIPQNIPYVPQNIHSVPQNILKPEKTIPVYKNIPVEIQPTTAPVIEPTSSAAPVVDPTPDVWSPNMESRKGLVSIERVKARTLQTIPFSEDPVWKEMEGLTSFEKSEQPDTKVNYDEIDALLKLATGNSRDKSLKTSNLNSDTVMSSSFTQPAFGSQSLNVPIDRQRKLSDSEITLSSSKKPAFAPPTIQPLKLKVGHDQKSSASALDEVLEDIRASLEKKPLSPKLLKNIDASDSNSSTNVQSPLTKATKPFNFPKKEEKVITPQVQAPVKSTNQSAATPGYDNVQATWLPGQTGPSGQSGQTYAPPQVPPPGPSGQSGQPNAPPQVPPQVAKQLAEVGYIDPEFTQFPYIINGNYHLDPALLSEKLKSTGLVNDSSDEGHRRVMNLFTQNQSAKQNTVSSNVKQTTVPVSQAAVPGRHGNQVRVTTNLDQSVGDLKSLAKEVEQKLSQIKSRIVSADEDRLDSILLALRKFAPMTEQRFFNVKFTPNYESEHLHRNKLEDALYELDKMYASLNLEDASLLDRASRIEETTRSTHNLQERRASLPEKKSSTVTTSVFESNASAADDPKLMRRSQIDEIERQTQNEFEDITKSFTVLLDEVTRQCRTVAQGSSNYNPGTVLSPGAQYSSQPPIDVITQERSQLKYETPSQRAVQDSYNTAIKELESVATGSFGISGNNKQVQSSVYLNLDTGKPANEKANQSLKISDKITSTRSLDITVQSKPTSQRSQSKLTVAPAQFVSMATEFKPSIAVTTRRETSSSDNQEDIKSRSANCQGEPKSNGKTRSGRFRKRGNIEHRKSMPALMRTVETQTVETQTEPVQTSPKKEDILRNFSVPDFSSDSSPDTRGFPVIRKLSSGIAKFVDIFDSSEDERAKESKLKHSLSAPDLVALFDAKPESKLVNAGKTNTKLLSKNITPKSVKHRSEAKSRFRSLKDDASLKKLDMTVASPLMMSSVTSEEGVDSPTTKPPVYPVWKYPGQGDVPFSPKRSEKKQAFGFDKDPLRVQSDTDRAGTRELYSSVEGYSQVVRRRTRSVGSDHEDEDRPKSFHELLATFEQSPQRLEKFRSSALRKCASEDSVYTDLILQKIYHSDSDLSQDLVLKRSRSGSGSGLKLQLEMKVKN